MDSTQHKRKSTWEHFHGRHVVHNKQQKDRNRQRHVVDISRGNPVASSLTPQNGNILCLHRKQEKGHKEDSSHCLPTILISFRHSHHTSMASQIPFERPKNVSRHQTFNKDDMPNIRQRIGDKKESGILDRTKRFNHGTTTTTTTYLLLVIATAFAHFQTHHETLQWRRSKEDIGDGGCMYVCMYWCHNERRDDGGRSS
jgi:hypothetical protein